MNWAARHRSVVALLLLCGSSAAAIAATDSEILIVELFLNGRPSGEAIVLQSDEGDFLVAGDVLREWQITEPWPESVHNRGSRYYRLASLPGVAMRFDRRKLELHVSVPPELMPVQTVGLGRRSGKARLEDNGAYLDYDVNWISNGGTGEETTYSLFRPVVFGGFGNVAASLTYRDFSGGNVFADGEARSGLNVLELTYSRDDPARMRTLRVGDVVTRTGIHGRAFRLGGIQFGTNFETQPTFIRYPLPSFYGETSVPSALDVYINGQLRRSEEVGAGRYVLEDIPAVNGAGQMQIVARDALGRQQVFAEDIYIATDLLREGLSEYSFNLGALREEFALQNFRYGDLAAAATWRHGQSDRLTIEGHGEFTDGLAMLGGALQFQLGGAGTTSVAIAGSHARAGIGLRWQLGYRQQATVLSYNLDVSGTTREFASVGQFEAHPKIQALASVGKNFFEFGSLGMSLVHQRFHQESLRTIVSATHTKTFPNFLSLVTFVSVIRAETDDVTAGIRLSLPFGDRMSVGGGVAGNRGDLRAEAEVRRSIPVGTGYGYHLGANASDASFVDAGVMYQNEIGRYSLDVRSSSRAGSLWEAGASGSIAYLSGMTNFTRQIRDAFAVVNVGGIEGVRVYRENQEVGRTNGNGQLFVPALRPYLGNKLRIELEDLPLNARIGNVRTETVPYYRSGVVVNFDVSLTTNVLLRAVLPDGTPVPEGALARVTQSGELFPVGLDGKLYLQGIDRSSQVEIRYGRNQCALDVPYPAGEAVIARIGDVVCKTGPAP